jgi:hypothetical protein
MIPRAGYFDPPGVGEAGDDYYGDYGDDEPKESWCECCDFKIRVSVRTARSAVWRKIDPPQTIYPGDEVEVLVSTSCRMEIDMLPDRLEPISGIAWSEISFGSKVWFDTRHKVAYYCARTVQQLTEVEFHARGTCECEGSRSSHLVTFQLHFAASDSEGSNEPEGSNERE